MRTWLPVSLVPVVSLLACDAFDLPGSDRSDDLTSNQGVEAVIEYDSFVYVPAGADDGAIRWAIQRQIKSSLGALREIGIGVSDRDAQRNLDPAGWQRHTVIVVNAGGAAGETLQRVTFHYRDTALVEGDRVPRGPFELTLLAGDYVGRAGELIPDCSDDPAADPDSLWYHYSPRRSACQRRIRDERAAIDDAAQSLDDANLQVSRADADRRFVTSRATLELVDAPPDKFPEYDQLWGFAGNRDRTKVVVYAFFGVDRDESDPNDYGLREFLRFQRTLRDRFDGLQVTHTAPFAMLLDFWIDGRLIEGVSFDDVEDWILDGRNYPAEVAGDSSKIAALEQQVVERFSERWIYWALPVEVTDGSETRHMTVEIRSFYGYEDGNPDVRQRAQWRYLEAFWHGDVFAYTGHSHFGHGPLAPFYYRSYNFPWRYQVMLINSCLSFNYYDRDFLDMHPGGTANLDIVVNGLAAYWHGMGEATAQYVISLIDGGNNSWRQVLAAMRVDLPWERAYDPMRAVNGELDNAFDARARPITVSPR